MATALAWRPKTAARSWLRAAPKAASACPPESFPMPAAYVVIKASPDFQRIARHVRRWSGPAFIMQILVTGEDAGFRLGLTASKKVGNAVIRNRAKRRLREMVRLFLKTKK